MRINTNTKLYKINLRNYGSDVPKSLCPYFWASIFSVLFLSWLGPLVGLLDRMFGNISVPKFNIGLFRYMEKHGKKIPYFLSGGLIAFGAYGFFFSHEGIGLWNIGLGSGLMVWSKYSSSILKRTFKTTYRIPTREHHQPSVFKEYMKAKHHSICPTLEFVDFEKENFNDSVKKIAKDAKAVLPEAEKIMELSEKDPTPENVEEILKTTDKMLDKAYKHDLYPDEK